MTRLTNTGHDKERSTKTRFDTNPLSICDAKPLVRLHIYDQAGFGKQGKVKTDLWTRQFRIMRQLYRCRLVGPRRASISLD